GCVFFQAEDGIREWSVTGVQTCALPILMARVPDGARLVSSATMPWPTVVMGTVWVLPGVPEIFQLKLPLIRSDLGGDRPFVSLEIGRASCREGVYMSVVGGALKEE